MAERHALLVETRRYLDRALTSDRPPARLGELAALLRGVGGFDAVTVLVDEPKSSVERAIERLLAGRAADDTVLLSLTGQVTTTPAGTFAYATTTTDTTLPHSTTVAAEFLRTLLTDCAAPAGVLLDCGHDGFATALRAPGAAVHTDGTTALIRGLRGRTAENGPLSAVDLAGYLDAEPPRRGVVPIGTAEETGTPIELDFTAAPHLVVLGGSGSGKTTLLRTVLDGIVTGHGVREAAVIVVDYRRVLAGHLRTDHLLGFATTAAQLETMVADIVSSLRRRIPAAADRSWIGPELFLVVDDYESVTDAARNPLRPLAELVPAGAGVGLHVVLTRGSAGSAHDPVLDALLGMSSPTIMLTSAQHPGHGLLNRSGGQQRIRLTFTPPD